MFKFYEKKALRKFFIVGIAMSMVICSAVTPIYASNVRDVTNGSVIYHNEEWVTPFTCIDKTVYDLGDGFTSTVTTTDEYSRVKASGTKTQTQTIDIKNGTAVAASVTVSGSFSYTGSEAKVTSASQTRSVKSGYAEQSWDTKKSNSSTFSSAYVSATLKVKNNSTGNTYSGTAKVTCGNNG